MNHPDLNDETERMKYIIAMQNGLMDSTMDEIERKRGALKLSDDQISGIEESFANVRSRFEFMLYGPIE